MSNDVTSMAYWFDIAIKGIIGIVVSIVGLDYRAVKNSLRELEQAKYSLSAQLQVVQSELVNIKGTLGSIDNKLTRSIEK